MAGMAPAGGLVEEELKGRGWEEADLAHRANGDVGEVAMAVRLRAESTLTVSTVRTLIGTEAG